MALPRLVEQAEPVEQAAPVVAQAEPVMAQAEPVEQQNLMTSVERQGRVAQAQRHRLVAHHCRLLVEMEVLIQPRQRASPARGQGI